ncbi:hypothetical protein BDW72DRAFT_184503 [Aspergillus terricola var. indicus]
MAAYSSLHTAWVFLLELEGETTSARHHRREGQKKQPQSPGVRRPRHVVNEQSGDRYPSVRITAVVPDCAWMYPTDITVRHELEPKIW